MKIEQQRRKVGKDGYTEILDYQIEASSKAFEILFKNVYSDPVKAILRELGTNAYDSHVEKGNKDKPFDIHLPTGINPLFYIRDYGVGLDGDELKNIYRVVFKSTKNNSNEQIGCFGLGCKTPFAYTDNYIIESFKNGRKYACNAFYSATSKPALAFTVDGDKTTEPDGLKVTLIIKPNDSSIWLDRAKEVYRYFTVKPNFLGQKIVFEPVKYVMEGTGWGLRSTDGYYGNTISAIMGQIPYRISVGSVNGLSRDEINIANCGIDLFFNIGELSVEANREGIHLNERSCLAIKNKIKIIRSELSKQVEDSIKNESCLWDASLKLAEICSKFHNLSTIIDIPSIKYNGKGLINNYYLTETITKNLIVYNIDVYYRKHPRTTIRSRIDSQKTYFFVRDADSAETRIKYYIETNKLDALSIKYLLLEEIGDAKPNPGIQDFIDCIGLPKDRLINVSTLPKPPRVKRTYNRTKTSKVNLLNTKSGKWEDATIDLKDGQGFYVEMFQNYTVWNRRQKLHKPIAGVTQKLYLEKKVFIADLIKVQTSLTRLGFPVYNIYGVRSSHIKKLGPRWKSFYDYAESKLSYITDIYSFSKKKKPYLPNNTIFSGNYEYFNKIGSKVDETTPFHELYSIMRDKEFRDDIIKELEKYCSFFGIKPNINIIDCQNRIDKIMEKYYLLSKISPWSIDTHEEKAFLESVVNYINLSGESV